MLVFLAGLLVYVGLAVLLSRGVGESPASARLYGLIGGLVLGACWLLAIAPPSILKEKRAGCSSRYWSRFFGPTLVAAIAGRHTRDSTTGALAALWAGLVGGLTVFIVWVSVTYADAGGPYDAGLVRDFHKSGSPDLATYAVSDNLGSGLVLLLMIPAVALALGSLSARLHRGDCWRA